MSWLSLCCFISGLCISRERTQIFPASNPLLHDLQSLKSWLCLFKDSLTSMELCNGLKLKVFTPQLHVGIHSLESSLKNLRPFFCSGTGIATVLQTQPHVEVKPPLYLTSVGRVLTEVVGNSPIVSCP